ncbi:MAG: hypothetical protein WD492_12665 [Alkalispirochaeta sp.]
MKAHNTEEAAALLSTACGHTVGTHFIRRVYADLYGLDALPGTGTPLTLSERQVDAFRRYAVVNYKRRPPVPVEKWLRENGIAIPRLSRRESVSREVVRSKPPAKESATQASNTGIESQLSTVIRELKRQSKEIEDLKAEVRRNGGAARPKEIETANIANRRYVIDTVNRFVNERTQSMKSDYRSVWSNVYRMFFSAMGDTDEERWKVGTEYTSTLDYIERQGVLAELAGVLPEILDGLKTVYPVAKSPQRELFP